jgi:hypothetical protein
VSGIVASGKKSPRLGGLWSDDWRELTAGHWPQLVNLLVGIASGGEDAAESFDHGAIVVERSGAWRKMSLASRRLMRR